MICFVCSGTGALDQAQCWACNGSGAMSESGPPIRLATETFQVTGMLTKRVIVRWRNGRETVLYAPADK